MGLILASGSWGNLRLHWSGTGHHRLSYKSCLQCNFVRGNTLQSAWMVFLIEIKNDLLLIFSFIIGRQFVRWAFRGEDVPITFLD